MKKAPLFALASVFAAVAPALAYPPAPANVNFSSERGVPFGLVLDGRPLTRGLARQVHVDQLVPGLHWAEFSVPTAYGRAVRFHSRVWLEPGLETTFVLIARPGWPLDLRQVNAVALYGPSYGGGYGNGYHGGNGHRGRYNSPAPYGQGSYDNRYPASGGQRNDDQGQDDDDDDDRGYSNDPRDGYDGNNNSPNGGTGYYPGSATSSYRPLPPPDVEALVQAVRQRPFEASKLNLAKEALAQSSIQADDLKRLLQTLSSDASRVELAKFAYPHVADRQNFARVYQAFSFDTSRREVEQATANAPRN